ncbi:MAG TPA: DUF2306 domain-containing protein [Stellaceae bacterium]|nr:DUF2306 domain-containing protein [Stellaceae bacterium]
MTATPLAIRTNPVKYVAFVLLGAMLVLVLIGRDLDLLDAGSALRQRYMAVSWLMVLHGIAGAAALLIAPFQFSSRLRSRYLRVHRIMGYCYVAGVAIAASVSVPIAVILGPPELVMAAAIQATGWLLTTATALYCIRTGRIQQHREWMLRSYPFAVVFVAVRTILVIPAIDGMGEFGLIVTVWSCIAAACFVPSFLIAWRGLLESRR